MEKKEPYATKEEYNQRVIHYREDPHIVPFPGVKSNFVSGEKISVIFNNFEPNIKIPVHQHEAEQIMIVTGGAGDQIADGKLYHFEEGDVFIVPSNMPHGTYSSDKGLKTIEVFSPPRYDYIEKLAAAKKSLGK